MKILKFNPFKKSLPVTNKINFMLDEPVRRKSDNRLGRIITIGINKNKIDEIWIYWYDDGYTIDDFISNPNPIYRTFNNSEELHQRYYTEDEIKKLTPDEQEYIENINKYNL